MFAIYTATYSLVCAVQIHKEHNKAPVCLQDREVVLVQLEQLRVFFVADSFPAFQGLPLA